MARFGTILNQIGCFFLYLALGVFLRRKTGMLNEASLFSISEIVIKVSLPAFIFTSTVSGPSLEDFRYMLPALLIMILTYVLMYFLGLFLCRIFHLKGNSANIYRLCVTFANIGF